MTEDIEEYRKSFNSENPQFLEEGKALYLSMRIRYPEKTHKDLDNILNTFCAALFYTMKMHVTKENYKDFVQLVHDALMNNLD